MTLHRPNRLSSRAMAYVLAGGRGSRLKELTDRRAKPATDSAASIASSAMRRCVVHFPPITLTRRWRDTSTRCSRESRPVAPFDPCLRPIVCSVLNFSLLF